jgi:hypothetical protein
MREEKAEKTKRWRDERSEEEQRAETEQVKLTR